MLFEFECHAHKLQQAYEEALTMMEAAVPEVWPEGLNNNHTPVNTLSFADYNVLVKCGILDMLFIRVV